MRRHILLVALFLFALPSIVAAQVTAIITAPPKAALGDLVILDGSGSAGTAFRWVLLGSSKTFLPIESGKRAVFASGTAGEYVFMLVVGGQAQGGGVDVAMAEHHLIVGDGQPSPPIIPTPSPAPQPPPVPAPQPPPVPTPPVIPAGKYGFAQIAYDAAQGVPLPQRVGQGPRLAENFEAVAAAIAAGAVTSVREANDQLRGKNADVAGANRDLWLPVINAFAAKATDLARQGQLSTMDEHRAAYLEFASGLRLASK
jgi:hypothetical protein